MRRARDLELFTFGWAFLLCFMLSFPLEADTKTEVNGSPSAYSVFIENKKLGVAASREYFQSLLLHLPSRHSWFRDDPSMTSLLRLEESVVDDNIFRLHADLKKNLDDYLEERQKGWLISTDGRKLIALAGETDTGTVLSLLE